MIAAKRMIRVMIVLPALGVALAASTAGAVDCDGTELLCLDLLSEAEVTASGGVVLGGDFNADGFMPYDQGGLEWLYGVERDFTSGRIEVDVMGLVPVEAGELEGGKVSIFSFMGQDPEGLEGVGLQKMAPDYRDGHIFRYGMDDDGLADNWDAVIITGAGFGCYYSINDPTWQPDQVHHFMAEWSAAGLVLQVDDFRCESGGNGDTFNPVGKIFTLANRCEHYSNQQAVARFSDLRLWSNTTGPFCGNLMCEPGEDCASCPQDCPCPDEDVVEVSDDAVEPVDAATDDGISPEIPDAIPDDGPSAEEPAVDPGGLDPDGEGDPGVDLSYGGGCGCAVAI